ncbi:Ribonuclease HI [Kaistia soli DSM 19436]|uniref:ribonuclease H n=1 Tax=Kaistia soli DSM 19436 TaxID=1122133 RepID=A0A1M4YFJ7_9HYPH|nr:ribonuclease H [Kaistia soli]SHF04564.1 Ribonuclease HI [Kaistia soli DSM 19436]
MTKMRWDLAKRPKPELQTPFGGGFAFLSHPRPRRASTRREALSAEAAAAAAAFGPVNVIKAPVAGEVRRLHVRSDEDIMRARSLLADHVGADIEVFTDGGCSPNPGAGGWGVVVLVEGFTALSLYGGDPRTTNNRMEMTAAIVALRILPPARISIHSDSRYVIDGVTKWATGWKRKGLLDNPSESKLKNAALWLKLITNSDLLGPYWSWVRGHDGNHGNELADQLATLGREGA